MSHHRKAYLATLLILIGGLYLSAHLNDWTWFSRSGSLLVVIGILLTSNEVFEHGRELRHRRMLVDARINHRLDSVAKDTRSYHDWANDKDMKALFRSRYREEDAWLGESRGLYLLVLGTLVWGFGDLLPLIW